MGAGLTDRVVGLATREIRPEGADLEFVIEYSPRKIFDRMAGPNPFDYGVAFDEDRSARPALRVWCR
jgi:hypothetical protein